MRRQIVCLLCLLLLLLSTVASAKIVFSSRRDGLNGIYLMDDDGSNITLLTESKESKPCCPAWSPDGQQIVFQRLVRDTFEDKGIWTVIKGYVFCLMNADGTNIRQLTENDEGDLNGGRFSPDSTSIIFTKNIRVDDKLQFRICVLNIKTRKLQVISDEWGFQCDWSPDGKDIVFARGQAVGVHSTIWIMDADGHKPRPLVPAPGPNEFTIYRSRPRWSPDGKQIMFQQKEYKWVLIPNRGNVQVFRAFRYIICDRNGENIKQLQIPKNWEGYGMDWMDDGKSIVFGARVGIPLNEPLPRDFVYPPANIYKYHIHTREITRLTNHPGTDATLDWISDDVLSVTPNGKKKVTWGKLKQPTSE